MEDFYHAETERGFRLAREGFLDNNISPDPTIYLKVSCILFVRAGLFLSQVSSIPSSNIQILIFQNIIDISVNTVIYSLLGHLFAFGKDIGNFIGVDGFLKDSSNKNEFAEGWLIVVAVSGLLVAAIGDRISFFASLLLNALVSGFAFPIIIHWIISKQGWMHTQTLSKVYVSYKDYNYSGIVHMGGGFLAFLSLMVMNKRLLRFKDMDICSIPDNGPSLTLFGNFFMVIGFLGIGIPSEKYILSHLEYNFYGIVIVNMLLSAFGSAMSTLLLTFSCPCEPMHKWTSMRSVQAGISGIAIVAGGADVYYPLAALLFGIFNGFLFFFVSFLVNISPIEDYSNIIACHFMSGLIGTFLPPLFGIREGFNTTAYYSSIHFGWQFICDLALLAFITATFLPIILLLDYCSVLRSWDEDINHRRAVFASKSVKSTGRRPRFFNWRAPTQVTYLEPGYKTKDKPSQDGTASPTSQEKVDILFEKNAAQGCVQEGSKSGNSTTDFLLNCPEKPMYRGQTYLVNYVMNSKPMKFFEEIDTESRQTSETMVKGDCGDGVMMKNAKFFDIKLIKGIRNISDSKLFQKFKDNWQTPKKRMVWSREREIRCGSMTNIWVPSSMRVSWETQV